ncbi:MAG: DNA-directed DNA polymerase epsilon, subunit B [Piccolia ochrophora]|nr:MAG: DNA-directed DNA polymerase epsilon, subunit B [Piccolia ochrophora]
MSRSNPTSTTRTAPIFQPPPTPHHPTSDAIPSSSPAFGSPAHPIRLNPANAASGKLTILPILLPPPTLRPLAFRTFTKKHNLTLTSSALQCLASFIGKYCGAGWREEGLAEKVLEEVAKTWKKNGGGVLVEGDGNELKGILKSLESCMSGGRVMTGRTLSRQPSSLSGQMADKDLGVQDAESRPALGRDDSQTSLGMSALHVDGSEDEEDQTNDVKRWIKVVNAYEQPRLTYNVKKKHFEKITTKASLFPPPSHKTAMFQNRYNLIHQRLLRNESFQTPGFAPTRVPSLKHSASSLATAQQSYKITPIANLLGRNGSSHLLLGLLTIAPTGTLAIGDLTGSIALDIKHARPVPEDGSWFVPGMIVLVDGVYEEDYNTGGGLGGNGGVGGTIGGKFIGHSVGGPPSERRETTLGLTGAGAEGEVSAGGGFGWVDFLGVGSERAAGPRMRRIEKRILHGHVEDNPGGGAERVAILGDVKLDNSKTLDALRKVLSIYAADPAGTRPSAIVIMGNFIQNATMAGGASGSIEYKECFDALASVLSDFPALLCTTTFIFVPGDNDPWASAFSAGAATAIPRKEVPDLFTSRVKRAFTTAQTEAERAPGSKASGGEAIWTTNPARISLFGPTQELVLFRDDISGRFRRNALRFRTLAPAASLNPPDASGVDSSTEPEPELEPMDVDAALPEYSTSHVPTSTAPNSDTLFARKLTKTLLDQGHLSPFPLATRPVLWDYASALQLYPLPTALVLMDAEASPFAVTYEGCCMLNPGTLVAAGEGRKGIVRWAEYDAKRSRGRAREMAL